MMNVINECNVQGHDRNISCNVDDAVKSGIRLY